MCLVMPDAYGYDVGGASVILGNGLSGEKFRREKEA